MTWGGPRFIHLVIAPLKLSKYLPWGNEPAPINPESGVKNARSEFKAFDPVKGMLPGDLPGTAGR